MFGGRRVGISGAAPGPGGASLSQAAWLPGLRTLGTLPWFGGRVLVSKASQVFDAEGRLQDPAVQGQVDKYVAGFSPFVARLATPGADHASADKSYVSRACAAVPRHRRTPEPLQPL